MKALSIRQPWAWLILFGGKDIENRQWKEHHPDARIARRMIEEAVHPDGERILIHTGATMTKADYEEALGVAHVVSKLRPFPSGLTLPPRDGLMRGGFIGSARLYDVVTKHESPWFFGPLGLELRDPKPLERFIPAKGMLGFFDASCDGEPCCFGEAYA